MMILESEDGEGFSGKEKGHGHVRCEKSEI